MHGNKNAFDCVTGSLFINNRVLKQTDRQPPVFTQREKRVCKSQMEVVKWTKIHFLRSFVIFKTFNPFTSECNSNSLKSEK